MSWSLYYSRWVSTALRRAFGTADLIAGGIASVAAIIGHYLPRLGLTISEELWQVPLWTFGAVAVFRLLAAPFWMAEEDAAQKKSLEAELLHERDARYPQISIHAEACQFGGTAENDPGRAVVSLVVRVTNTGAPSACINWWMRFEHDGVVTPVNLAISTEFDWHLGNREGGDAMVLRRGDEIFEKTITPVQTGGVVRGFILGFVPSEFTRRATATGKAQGFIVVGCEDVRGKVIQERYELGKAPISYPMHHPGMRGSKD